MKNDERDFDQLMDEAIREVRDGELPQETIEKAEGRLRERLRLEAEAGDARDSSRGRAILDCSGFQALIPDYLQDRLPTAKRLLLEDHCHECVNCRHSLEEARRRVIFPQQKPTAPVRSSSIHSKRVWAIAASIMCVALLLSVLYQAGLFTRTVEADATLQSLSGSIYRVDSGESDSVTPGNRIKARERLRTAKNSNAVLSLADGSEIEMGQRSELGISPGSDGMTINLRRGNVIVRAAKQRKGHLYVVTSDLKVAVKGTVFSVSHGTKGSRVSVVEGQVRVLHGKEQTVLSAGQQYSSGAALSSVPVAEEVGWSRNVDDYRQRLREVNALKQDIRHIIDRPATRYSSRLLGLIPAQTRVFFAFPNVSTSVAEAYSLFQERINESPILQQWYQHNLDASGRNRQLEQLISTVQDIGSYLGGEIVVALAGGTGDHNSSLLLMATTSQEEKLESALRNQVGKEGRSGPSFSILRGSTPTQETSQKLSVWIGSGLVAASDRPGLLNQVIQSVQSSTPSKFEGTEFHDLLARTYAGGVDWLFAADVHSILESNSMLGSAGRQRTSGEPDLEQIGLGNASFLVAEHKSIGQQKENRLTLTFTDERSGMAAWLASPAPMGSLDFISPDAYLATAAVIKSPALILDDLFNLIQSNNPDAWDHIVQFQIKEGINLRSDLASTLGGEVAFAVDGPVLPKPSWKLILEVYDPARLQQTIQWALDRFGAQEHNSGSEDLEFSSQTINGMTFYRISFPKTGAEIDYLYTNGYLVAASSRPLLIQTLSYQATGYTLVNDARFTRLLPRDGHTNCSAIFYQRVGDLVSDLSSGIPGVAGALNPQQQGALAAFASEKSPMLLCAYASRDQITLAGLDNGMAMGLGLDPLLRLRRELEQHSRKGRQ